MKRILTSILCAAALIGCGGSSTIDPQLSFGSFTEPDKKDEPKGPCDNDEYCDDSITCTTTWCTENNVCAMKVNEGWCLSAGDLCISAGEANPENACELCSQDAEGYWNWNPTSCDDGNVCNGVETCVPETGCISGTPLECDDGIFCNGVEMCEPESGCVSGAPACDPAYKSCNEETKHCDCINDALCTDNVVCTTDVCDPIDGKCKYSVTPGFCLISSACWDDGEEDYTGCNVCDASNPSEWTPVNNGELCYDGNPCSTDPVCEDGTCVATDQECDDANPCTIDVCDPLVGCSFTPTEGECDDGNSCTTGDICSGGACLSTGTVECNDGAECATVTCDPQSGCMYDAVDSNCDDNDACNGIETCDVTDGCVQGAALVCDDGLPCNGMETCNPTTGCTAGTPLANCCMSHEDCEDGNACNGIFICINSTCEQKNAELTCNDGNACNGIESCHPTEGCVSTAPTLCDDGNLCTIDSCDDETGNCSFVFDVGAPCDDGNVCTSNDVCEDFKCEGTPVNCDDGIYCNGQEWCNIKKGCQFGTNIECTDGNACNGEEFCDEESQACKSGEGVVCDDNNPCTDDACMDGECTNVPNTAPCSDDDACTQNDTCNAGSCSGTTIICDDDNVCTVDTCNAGTCSFEKASLPCSDGDSCTSDDACVNGECIGIPKSCNDGNPCTDDMCVDNACVFTPNTSACNDGNACTENDTCNAGTCSGTTFLCNDGNACTEDSCDPEQGCNFLNLNGPANGCGDGNPCAGTKACVEGSCQTVAVLDCDDNNPCTDDSCVAGVGCFHQPNDKGCDDGNPCTNNICSGGTCTSTANPCDDGNPCTIDSCDNGCTNTPLACDDGNECTDDTCVDGECQFVPNTAPCDDGDECTTSSICESGSCVGSGPDIDKDGLFDGPGESCDQLFLIKNCPLPEGHMNTGGCQKALCNAATGEYLFTDPGFYQTPENKDEWLLCIGFDADGDGAANVGNDSGTTPGADCDNDNPSVKWQCWPDGTPPPFGNSLIFENSLPDYMSASTSAP